MKQTSLSALFFGGGGAPGNGKRKRDDAPSSAPSSTKAERPTASGPLWHGTSFSTVVRAGRRLNEARKAIKEGTELEVLRDVTNEADAHAIKLVAVGETRKDVGYVPRFAATHLSGLLDTWEARASVVNPGSSSDPICVSVRFKFKPSKGDGDGALPSATQRDELDSVLIKAEDAQCEQFRAKCAQVAEGLDVVLGSICARFVHLFADSEMRVIRGVRALPLESKALLVRLFMRKDQWFKVSGLRRYVEIRRTDQALRTLRDEGVLDHLSESCAPLSTLLDLLTVKDLQKLVAGHHLKPPKGVKSFKQRKDLVAAMVRAARSDERIELSAAKAVGECVCIRPDVKQSLNLARFAYFLNDVQGLERFSLTHTGVWHYPEYKIDRNHEIFATRQDLIDYQSAVSAESEVQAAMEAGDLRTARAFVSKSCALLGFHLHEEGWTRRASPGHKSSVVSTPVLSKEKSLETSRGVLGSFQPSWVHIGIAHVGVSLLEKQRLYADAIELIQVLLGRSERPSKRGDWWNRFAIDLEHVSHPQSPSLSSSLSSSLSFILHIFLILLSHSQITDPILRSRSWIRSLSLTHSLVCDWRLWGTQMGRIESSLEVAETALHDDRVRVGPRLALQRRVIRLGKPPRRWKKPSFFDRASWKPRERGFVARPTNRKRSVKSTFVGFDDEDDVTVEQLALQFYASEDQGQWKGVHSENGIWGTLFGLLMWDQLFSGKVSHAFHHPFQTAPLDLDTDGFYAHRREGIDARLAEISAGKAPALLRETWEREHPKRTFCVGVSWDRYPLEDLMTVCECVGGEGLSCLMRLKARDHKSWQGGMPDLVLWRTEPRKESILAEVKGPRDALSDKQRAWLAELHFCGKVSVEVCKINEPEGR